MEKFKNYIDKTKHKATRNVKNFDNIKMVAKWYYQKIKNKNKNKIKKIIIKNIF